MHRATVLTDASFCPKTGAAGWACWIASDRFRSKQYYGKFREPVENAFDAELQAVINGMYYARQNDCSILLLQTDCKEVFESKKPTVRGLLTEWMDKLEVNVTFRHVKGHEDSNKGGRYYCNNWCDKFAKKAMNEMRKELS